MTDDQKLAPADPPVSADPVLEPQAGPQTAPAAEGGGPSAEASPPAPAATPMPTPVSAAVEKFKSCRWRCSPEDGEFCTHRDVLPFAGKDGFVAESWCPDCAFYKLRRTPKKRERVDYTY
jgi:hypothetical protein